MVPEMYEELVERLRKRAVDLNEKFSRNAELLSELMQTANAIEDLQEDNTELNGTVSNLIEQIKELSKPKWIPVTEQLPEKRKWVLCRCEANITEVLRYENNEWYHDPRHVYYFDFVTHWMPLPERLEEET